MVEHKTCKGCPYNHYPLCYGTIMLDGSYMNIENQKECFQCGQKDKEVTDFSIEKKSELELRVEELETKINSLEEKS